METLHRWQQWICIKKNNDVPVHRMNRHVHWACLWICYSLFAVLQGWPQTRHREVGAPRHVAFRLLWICCSLIAAFSQQIWSKWAKTIPKNCLYLYNGQIRADKYYMTRWPELWASCQYVILPGNMWESKVMPYIM